MSKFVQVSNENKLEENKLKSIFTQVLDKNKQNDKVVKFGEPHDVAFVEHLWHPFIDRDWNLQMPCTKAARKFTKTTIEDAFCKYVASYHAYYDVDTVRRCLAVLSELAYKQDEISICELFYKLYENTHGRFDFYGDIYIDGECVYHGNDEEIARRYYEIVMMH